MTLQVETGQKLSNNNIQVSVYHSIGNTPEKYALKNYSVPEDKKDEFSKSIKAQAKTSTKLIVPSMIAGSILGSIIGWRCTTNKLVKPISALITFIGGGVIGCLPAAIYDYFSNKQILQKYNAQKLN